MLTEIFSEKNFEKWLVNIKYSLFSKWDKTEIKIYIENFSCSG